MTKIWMEAISKKQRELTKLASINLKVSSPKSELVLFAQTTTRQMRTDVFLETVCPEI